jgi:glutamyl-Q tRNA(Asp) synthetase
MHAPTTILRVVTQPVFRFAPSPNGRLHLGHAFSALLNRALADRMGGVLLLRIEDIDPTRCRPELEQAIHDDLAWLGVRFDAVMPRQSSRMGAYRQALDTLAARRLTYRCVCSRGDIRAAVGSRPDWPQDPDGAPLYPGTCRAVEPSTDRPSATRLATDRALALTGSGFGYRRFDLAGAVTQVAADPARWGDAVLARKETPTSYHLAVVVDDAAQGVTHVVRGQDLEAATDLHVLLQRLLGLPTPAYHVHALIRDAGGDKLAKSRGSPGLAELRAAGVTADEIRRRLGFTRASDKQISFSP